MTSIAWTDITWNPTVGCSRVSPGCDSCYAIGVAHRGMQEAHRGLTVRTPSGPDWTGEVRTLDARLETPFTWPGSKRVFVDSMSDLFHEDLPYSFLVNVWATMSLNPQHVFQVLTKRQRSMRDLLAEPSNFALDVMRAHDRLADQRGIAVAPFDWPLPNVWLGVSAESQRYAEMRIRELLAVPAAVRWVSAEPLLGPIDLRAVCPDETVLHFGLDWVVAGGESGPKARPMHPDWLRTLRDQCKTAGVAFLVKQWGQFIPTRDGIAATHRVCLDGTWYPQHAGCLMSNEELVQKVRSVKLAGRALDGVVWDQYPDEMCNHEEART